MKSYRENELKAYVIATILVYFLVENTFWSVITAESLSTIQLVATLLELAIVSSSIYAFVFVLDSVYSSDLKRRLVFLGTPEPGQVIFDKIESNHNDIRFSNLDAKRCYKGLYDNRPQNEKEKRIYENQQWYLIYHRYKTVEMVAASAKDFRLCRDIFIATINIFLVYLILCLISDVVSFNRFYVFFLIIMMLVSNIAARNKASKWVYNVIAHDISEKLTERTE